MSRQPLSDVIDARTRLLLVGINPGERSAALGHHFAGTSNRFWRVLFESGLVTEPLTWRDDRRLPEWGLGLTNLVPRPTRGIDTLTRADYAAGRRALLAKIARRRPALVGLVGLTLARVLRPAGEPCRLGPQPWTLAGRPVFVVPNPSGRNAHYRDADLRAAFRALASAAAQLRS